MDDRVRSSREEREEKRPVVKIIGSAELKEKLDQLPEKREPVRAYTCDALLLAELLIQLIARLDYALDRWQSQQYVLSRVQNVVVGTDPTLLYENSHPYPITLEIFNLDPAQTVFIGRQAVTIYTGVPIFPESGRKVTIESGDHLYAVVEAGTVNVRLMTTTPMLL